VVETDKFTAGMPGRINIGGYGVSLNSTTWAVIIINQSLLQPEKSRKRKTRYLKNLKNKGELIEMRKKRKYLIPELRIFKINEFERQTLFQSKKNF
jgi:hypothetical protein